MAKKTPLQLVNELHGGKEKLVDKVMELLDRGEESKEDLRARMRGASNTKLMRLFDVESQVKAQFGAKDQLVGAILKLMNREKDNDYREKIGFYRNTRLLDMHHSWARRAKGHAA